MANLVKGIAIGVLFIFLMLGYVYQEYVFSLFGSFLSWVQLNPGIGAIYYVFIYSLSAILCIPAVILTLGSGYIFTTIYNGYKGYIIACIVDFTGATCGALLAFIVCKLLFFNWVNGWAKQYKQFEIAQILMKKDGLKVMMLLRVLMPYNPLNYLLGITNISIQDYLFACIGMIPSTMGWCFIGSGLSTLTEISKMNDKGIGGLYDENPNILIIGIVFISLFIFGMIWISKKAKREFKLMSDKLENDKTK
eukprot:405119_1